MSSPETTISGLVVAVQYKQVGQKETPLRTVVVECGGGQYPSPVPVEFFGADMAKEAEPINEGDAVEIECYVNGRAWNDRHFVSVRARKIGYVQACAPGPIDGVTDSEREPQPVGAGVAETDDQDSDLPF